MVTFSPERFATLTPDAALERIWYALERARSGAAALIDRGGDWADIQSQWIQPWCDLRLEWNQADFFASLSGQAGWSLGSAERQIQKLLHEVRTSPRVWAALTAADPANAEQKLVRDEMMRAHWSTGVTLTDPTQAGAILQNIYRLVEEYETLLARKADATELKPRLAELLESRRIFAAEFDLASFHEYVAERSLSSNGQRWESWLRETALRDERSKLTMPTIAFTWDQAMSLVRSITARVYGLTFEPQAGAAPAGLEAWECAGGVLYLQRASGKVQPMTVGLAPRLMEGRPAALVRCGFGDRLTFGNLRTLLHEMGHAIQHLMTNLQEPMISGLESAPMDLVELSSSVLEDFLLHDWAYESLNLSHSVVDACRNYHQNFQASRLAKQAHLARLDLLMHGKRAGDLDELAASEPNYPRFHHVITSRYAGCYFAYALGRQLSSRLHASIGDPAGFGRTFARAVFDMTGRRDPLASLKPLIQESRACGF